MDRFCIDRGTLLDNPRIRTLEQPDMHSYHCLLDVGVCNGSGYEMLMDPTNPGDLYTRAVRFDDDDTSTLIDLGRSLGDCSTCTGEGSEKAGFRVTVTGTLQDLGSANDPPLLKLNEVDEQAQGCADDVTDVSDMMDELTFPVSTSTGTGTTPTETETEPENEPVPSSTSAGTSSFTRSASIHGSIMLIVLGWFL